jgi:hypothetical protein
VLGRVGLRPDKDKHVVCLVRLGAPYLLAIDDPFVADELASSAQRGKVRSGPRLRKALRPAIFSGECLGNEALLLILRAPFQERRDQERDAAVTNLGRRFRSLDLLADDLRFDHVGCLFRAAVTNRN